MNAHRSSIRWPMVLFAVAVIMLAMANSGLAHGQQGVPQQTTCAWRNIGTSTLSLFHVSSAMDTDANKLYVYGGVDENLEPNRGVEAVDLSSAGLSAKARSVSAGGSLALVGAAGAYRAKGKDNDASAAYFFGGAKDAAKGQGGNDVQRYLTKAGTWEKVSAGSATAFSGRFFAAAAYDPVHDVLWVAGGIGTCKFPDVLNGKSCTATSMSTTYLSFDPASGAPTWNTLAGGDQRIYGQTMVYDPTRHRMLLFGGTADIKMGTNAVKALDLSDPDPAKAKWATVTTSGTAPQIYFHGAGFDASRDWMVVYGGVKKDFMQSSEQINGTSYALDFSKTPPTWTDLRAGTGPSDRIGAAMAYDPMHRAEVVTLGRQKMAFAPAQPTPTTPTPNPGVQETTWGLECGAVPTVTPSTVPTTAVPTITATSTGPTPTATRPPTQTPMPTHTPSPTETPVPATLTPSPTDTPTATSTPMPPPDIYLPIAYRNAPS